MDGLNVARLSSNRRPSVGGLLTDENSPVGKTQNQVPLKKQAVKRHHHKHNLKHRYEFLETLGKGTYGKVKKAKERSGRLVRRTVTSFIMRAGGRNRCLFWCPVAHLLFGHEEGLILADLTTGTQVASSSFPFGRIELQVYVHVRPRKDKREP